MVKVDYRDRQQLVAASSYWSMLGQQPWFKILVFF